MGIWMNLMVWFMVCWFQRRQDLALENIELRQQLAVLQRSAKRPRFTDGDRLFWMIYSRITDGWQKVLRIARPQTILDWQRSRFKKFWARKCRRKGPGRPQTDRDVQELIRTLSRSNPTWGTSRIIGELAKLGIRVFKRTVDKYRVRRKGTPSPSWKAFLSNETKAIAGMDFFTVATATFGILYVFVVLMHKRRRVVHFNVTANPTATWTAQQIVEAFPWNSAPKYLIRDNDSIYGAAVSNRVKGMGIKETKTA